MSHFLYYSPASCGGGLEHCCSSHTVGETREAEASVLYLLGIYVCSCWDLGLFLGSSPHRRILLPCTCRLLKPYVIINKEAWLRLQGSGAAQSFFHISLRSTRLAFFPGHLGPPVAPGKVCRLSCFRKMLP